MGEYRSGRIPKKLNKYSAQDIAEVLKDWLQLLPQPLVPQHNISGFVKVQSVGSSWSGMDEHSEKIKELRTAVQGLPDANRVALSAFCVMLHVYSKQGSRDNLEEREQWMRSLVECFDVLIFCLNGDKALRANGMHAAMNALIEYSPYLFEGKEYVVRNASPEPYQPSQVADVVTLKSPTSMNQTLAASAGPAEENAEPISKEEELQKQLDYYRQRLESEALETKELQEKIDELQLQMSQDNVDRLIEREKLLREDNEHLKKQCDQLRMTKLDAESKLRDVEQRLRSQIKKVVSPMHAQRAVNMTHKKSGLSDDDDDGVGLSSMDSVGFASLEGLGALEAAFNNREDPQSGLETYFDKKDTSEISGLEGGGNYYQDLGLGESSLASCEGSYEDSMAEKSANEAMAAIAEINAAKCEVRWLKGRLFAHKIVTTVGISSFRLTSTAKLSLYRWKCNSHTAFTQNRARGSISDTEEHKSLSSRLQAAMDTSTPVSYTHLTLPTKRIV
eukprot:TRINITY_DN29548_c0_g1_i1.p1 TRINITY_DN29548_c0_g1~~TRINITY_DN29548_c0_g1_i1.p1  ORF type:complete len:504 (-),score=48.46 TRINITY_DN29548_c0_g1_i1:110-1621(-)